MARPKNPEITAFILDNVDRLGTGISPAVQRHFGVTKQTAHRYLAELVASGALSATGSGRGRAYARTRSPASPLAPHETLERTFTQALDRARRAGEDALWRDDIEPLIFPTMRRNVRSILRHGFTEMVNNALDHSGGSELRYSYNDEGASIRLTVEDDGIGAYARLREGFQLPNYWEALGELIKGKRTTLAERHAGEGVFFTSRAFDVFSLGANQLLYRYFGKLDDWTVEESRLSRGTRVVMSIDSNSERLLDAVFAKYTSPDDLRFDVGGRFAAMPYTIAARDELVSRSEARRLLSGAEQFREVILDFKEVERVGQAFVDEVFRVWKSDHPQTAIVPINMRPNVEFMVRRGLAHVEAAASHSSPNAGAKRDN
jgi:hypothetical protein